eukprot:CAMPEP_0197046558 /NCGR_PEP_ID=MMETSP1384-20130603/22260_1 /TAXON_ID=29189 /ORGANISM="Ammonia sp." /LENGTH=142 /DNA_ID=CAMNT_0042478375 /DNA_START=44 /DNA_END=468 /DNA_ORIENTATION=-
MNAKTETQMRLLQGQINSLVDAEKKENDNVDQRYVAMNAFLAFQQEMRAFQYAMSSHMMNARQPTNGVDAVRAFFETELNLPQYVDVVIENGFETMSLLLNITKDDLKEMNVKIAHRKIIMEAIQAKQHPNDADKEGGATKG